MKSLFSLLLLTLLFCWPLQGKEVFVNGTAKIYDGDKIHAKNQALKNALLEAVKKGLQTVLTENTIAKNYEVIKGQFYRASQNYISSHVILAEEMSLDNTFYESRILAQVDLEKIRRKLNVLRITHDGVSNKKVLLIYHSRIADTVALESTVVQDTLAVVNNTFAEQGFQTFNQNTMKRVQLALKELNTTARSVDSLLAAALNLEADILLIMGITSVETDKLQGAFYKVSSTVYLSLYAAPTGQQIAETVVEQHENSVHQLSQSENDILLASAAKQAGRESARRSIEQLTRFYQNSGTGGQSYAIVFSGYSPRRENLIVDYLENSTEVTNLAEVKNTPGLLELELVTLMRKSTLRRRITSDLLELEIETATKSVAGNQLILINPNPMEEEDKEEEEEVSADATEAAVESTKNDVPSQ
ncbi:MAG: hypothetical protein H8E38_04470 [SAR324 cluster bacterium]|nr:hypothetical protein [SAR324 cluster bacterium]MBL7035604.1 hypothetical protein [SAR324 cluster bacterium]